MAGIEHRRWRTGLPWESSTKAKRPRVLTRRQRRHKRWAASRSQPSLKRRRHSDNLFFTDVSGSAVESATRVASAKTVVPGAETKPIVKIGTFDGNCFHCNKPGHRKLECPELNKVMAGHEAVPGGVEVVQEPPLKRPRQAGAYQELRHEDGRAQELGHLARYLAGQLPKKSGKQEFLDSLRYHAGASGSNSARHTDDGHLTKFGAKQVCVVCLQDHKAWECPETRCFVCYETGHEVKSCPNMKLTCTRCYRTGHCAEGCIRDSLTNSARRINWDEVRCMRCGEFGHPNCVENQYPPRPPPAVVPPPLLVRPRAVAPPHFAARPPPPPPPAAKLRELARAGRKSKAKIEDCPKDAGPQEIECIGRSSQAERARCRQAGKSPSLEAATAGAAKSRTGDGWRWHQLGEESEPSEEDASLLLSGRAQRRVAAADATSSSTDQQGSRRERDRGDAGRSGVLDELRAKMAKQKGRNGVHADANGTNGRGAVDTADPAASGKSPLLQSLLALKVARGLR